MIALKQKELNQTNGANYGSSNWLHISCGDPFALGR
jgi:hypothetical protein